MKKLIKNLMTGAMALVMMVSGVVVVHADAGISVTIDGERVEFAGQQPVNVGGRTLVPVRGVFEMMGFEVDWDGETRTAIITNADYTMLITIGSYVFTTNGIEHTLDVPAQVIGGSTMVPIRLPLESVGFDLDWDSATSTVLISDNQMPGAIEFVYAPEPLLSLLDARSISMVHIEYDGRTVFLQDQALGGATREYLDDLVRGLEDGMFRVAYGNMNFVTTILDFPLSYLRYPFFAERGLLERINPDHMGGIARVNVPLPSGGQHPPTTNLTPAEFERRVLELTNIERARYGAPPVVWCDILANAARDFSMYLTINNRFSHFGTDGSGPGNRVVRAGGVIVPTSENLVRGLELTPEQAVEAWMNSPGHRSNLLNPNRRYLGVGIYTSANNRSTVTQKFTNSSANPLVAPILLNVTFAGAGGQAIGGNNVRFIDNGTGESNEQGAINIRTTQNTSVSLTAEPRAEHIEFVRWEIVNGNATIANPYSATTTINVGVGAVEDGRIASVNVHAVFREVGTTATQINRPNHISLTSSQLQRDALGNGILFNGTNAPLYDIPITSTVTVTAIASAGWRFHSWEPWGGVNVANINNPNTTITFDHDVSGTLGINARFELDGTEIPATIFAMGVSSQADFTVHHAARQVIGQQYFSVGDVISISARPPAGQRFVSWHQGIGIVVNDIYNPNTTATFVEVEGLESSQITIRLMPIFEPIGGWGQ